MEWLGYALIAIIVPWVINALNKSADVPAEFREGKTWLTYGLPLKIFSILSLGFPLAGVLYFFFGDYESIYEPMGFTLFFSLISVPMMLESFLVRIAFDDEYIYCFSPWRANRQVAFSALAKPYYSDAMQWWVIPTESQGYIRVQSFISGKDELLERVSKSQE
ncbi:MAG: hypothetical protein OEY06_13195 [Gammaproteobacteria bacterium]|nr:hypothetical protein [Gammaproteobacteria bacterium]MDH5389387.1 hypothetical protein [Gammaproteobacteria bacterium]